MLLQPDLAPPVSHLPVVDVAVADLPIADPGVLRARVTRVDRSAYDALAEGSGALLRVAAPRPTTDPHDAPTVGDWVDVIEGPLGWGTVAVLPRTSLLVRGTASGRSAAQPLAANIDTVLVCAGLSSKLPLRRIERLLTLAWESGATPVVLLTKADLCDNLDDAVRQVLPHAPGVDVVTVSAASRDLASLDPYVGPGVTLVLLGASGAGKSTLVNGLAGSQVMATGNARQVDGKGRHTTTHRELITLPSGAVIIDTPGLRGVALNGGGEEGLAKAFADVEELATACRFADCGHQTEPGCAITASVEAGDLGQDRVDSWRKLEREMAFQARRTDLRLRAEAKARGRSLSKQQRAQGYRP